MALSTKSVVEVIADNSHEKRTGMINVEDLGCRSGDNSSDLGETINKATKDMWGTINLLLPPGQWFQYSCINSIDKTINLFGSGVDFTEIRNLSGRSSYFIMRQNWNNNKGEPLYMGDLKIKGINFQCAAAPTGKIEKVLDLAGLRIYHKCLIEQCSVVGFTGGGIQIYADMEQKLNASGSTIRDTMIANSKGDGLFVVGDNANNCVFQSLDIRDNTGVGLADHSFLGSAVIGVMTHANKRSFHVENGFTAKSSFIGCYHEVGQEYPSVKYGEEKTVEFPVPGGGGMFTWDLGALNLKQ